MTVIFHPEASAEIEDAINYPKELRPVWVYGLEMLSLMRLMKSGKTQRGFASVQADFVDSTFRVFLTILRTCCATMSFGWSPFLILVGIQNIG
jgi:hypothetical protein